MTVTLVLLVTRKASAWDVTHYRQSLLSLVKLEVLIQKCWQSLCYLWWSGVLSYVLLLLRASHMAEKKFASHRSV